MQIVERPPAAWMSEPAVPQLLAALREAGRPARFVGVAALGISEVYLRLLPFFRFFAHYGGGPANAAALAAAASLAPNIARLSAERVWSEMKRLLAAPDPAPTVRLMQEQGVLAHA